MTIIGLSGGIDSTYCLWDALRSGRKVISNHIRLISHEGRQDVEDTAAAGVVEWLRAQGFVWTHHTSTFDYGSIRPISLDLVIWGTFAGLLATERRRDRPTVTISAPQGSAIITHGPRLQQIINYAAGRPVTLEWPIATTPKADLIAAMPPELLNLCWWCRRPQDSQPCHRCPTCRNVDRIMASMVPMRSGAA